MAFIDEVKIEATAGNGGNGVVRWLHDKFRDMGGPAGGDGGKGGDVYFEAVSDMSLLERYRIDKKFKAESGEDGQNRNKHGKGGEDLILQAPRGSLITNIATGKEYELTEVGQRIKVLIGGIGGKGNDRFKSSTNQNPSFATEGKKGESAIFHVELRLFADVGFIGMPSAGKSSLLNELTNAKAKVGAYDFTTLEPNLGSMYGMILADIPGLIEGASDGKGLGHKFLRHIRRTKCLAHCISVENEDMLKTYEVIREELEKYDNDMAKKQEIIIVTKTDMCDEKELKQKIKSLSKTKKEIVPVSIMDEESVKNLSKRLLKINEL